MQRVTPDTNPGSELGFLVIIGAKFPNKAQNLFKIRKRFTRETVVQGRSANTDPQTQHIQRLEFGVKYVQ